MSHTEDNYLRAVFNLTERNKGTANTRDIARYLETSDASVTDMIKKLSSRDLLEYIPYHGVKLSPKGITLATQLIRRERLWKVFLHSRLDMNWNEINETAAQLKHVNTENLISLLDAFLENPKFDCFGDPIPNADGRFTLRNQVSLSSLPKGARAVLIGIRRQDRDFLNYLEKQQLKISSEIRVLSRLKFEQSIEILIDHKYISVLPSRISNELNVKWIKSKAD